MYMFQIMNSKYNNIKVNNRIKLHLEIVSLYDQFHTSHKNTAHAK